MNLNLLKIIKKKKLCVIHFQFNIIKLFTEHYLRKKNPFSNRLNSNGLKNYKYYCIDIEPKGFEIDIKLYITIKTVGS